MNQELDNRIVMNGRADANEKAARLRIKELETGISDFLHALDRGYFGSDLKSVDLSDSAFVDALRGLDAKNWSGR